jgi:hypothetical protein
MIQIGDKTILLAETLILCEGETALIHIPPADPLDVPGKIALTFRRRMPPDRKPGIVNWSVKDGVLIADCVGWESTHTTAMVGPKKVGATASGTPIGAFIAAYMATNGIFNVTIQIMKGGRYAE